MAVQEQGGMHVLPDAGASFFALTDWARTKISGEDTDGRFSVVEQTTLAGARPPLHTHEFDELHYIVAGEYLYYEAGKEPFHATAGAVIYTPRGIIHTYKNIGTTNGKLIATFTPAGFEKFFEEFGIPSEAATHPPKSLSPADIARLVHIVETQYQTRIMEPFPGR